MKRKKFMYVFFRKNDTIFKEIIKKFNAKPIDSTSEVTIFKFPYPIAGNSIISKFFKN